MLQILSKNISFVIDNLKKNINFKLNYSIVNGLINDQIRIFYSTYNFDTNLWTNEVLIESPYSKIIQNNNIIQNFISEFTTNTGGRYKFRLAVYRDNIEILSTTHIFKSRLNSNDYVDTSNRVIDPPKDVNLNIDTGVITWQYEQSFNSAPLKHFIITASYSRSLSIQRVVSKIERQYIFDNLIPGYIIFSIQSVDINDNKSRPIILNKKAYKIPKAVLQLFDKQSFINKINNSYIRNCLNAAADRWSTYIGFDKETYNIIQQSFEFKSKYADQFKGIRLRNFYIQNLTGGAVGACAPRSCVYLGNNKYNTIDFDLYLDSDLTDPDNFDPTSDRYIEGFSEYVTSVLAHELGHALGIGIYWKYNNTLPFPYSLNGNQNTYINTQQAYNKYIQKFTNTSINGKYVPLNFSGIGAGTHWADITNPTNNLTKQYPPIYYDIMSYGVEYITTVSIKHLVDLGYYEKNPGASEEGGIQTISTLSNNFPTFSCSANLDIEKPVIAIDASNHNNIIYYDEQIVVDNPCPSSNPVTPLTLNYYA